MLFRSSGDISLADECDDAVANKNEVERKQQEVISSLEGVSADLGQAYISLQNAQTSLAAAETELTSAEATLSEKEREKQIASDRLTTAQTSLDTVKQESEASKKTASETSDSVAEIVVSTYQGDNSVTSWSYVLASQNGAALPSLPDPDRVLFASDMHLDAAKIGRASCRERV